MIRTISDARSKLVTAPLGAVLLLMSLCASSWAQTNPTPQALPYQQDFNGLAWPSTTYPAGWQGWQIGAAIGASYSTLAPSADRALLATSSASNSTGGVHNYRGRLGLLGSGSVDASPVLAVNTSGQSGVEVTYDIMTIRNVQNATNTRINEVSLQYRVGVAGAFTTISGMEYLTLNGLSNNLTGTDLTTPQNLSTLSVVLPPACDNQPEVQIRWACRDVSGAGSRPGIAVDNVRIPVPGTHFINATAGAGGSISPSGLAVASDGSSPSYTITAGPGHAISDVVVDGVSQGAITGHTFTNVSAHHGIQASFTPTIPATGLVGWWKLDGSGADASGNGNHATVLNTPEYVPAIEGQAPSLNGSATVASAQYASAPNSASLDITGPMTLAAWVRPDRSGTQSIVTKASNGASNGYELTCAVTGFAFARLNQLASGDTYRVNSTIPYPTDGNTWQHVCTTYDGATLRLYINGVLNASVAGPASIGSNTGGLGIGNQFDGSGTRALRGAVDDARLYNRALAPAEIQALAGLPTYAIVATAGGNGTISPSGTVIVSSGANQTFTFTPAANHHVSALTVDGNVQAVAPSFDFIGISADHTIDVQFAIDTYSLTYTAGPNGTISGTSPQVVPHGGNGTLVTAVPNAGYHFVSWSDGVLTAARTDTGVMANLAVTATFEQSLVIDAGPASGAITLANPTVTVPVRITRASSTPTILAFSVTFTVNSPTISLPAGANSITLPVGGGFLNAAGDRNVVLQTLDLGGGTYQADGTTLGAPCGSSALTGTLFEIAVSSAQLSGLGAVTVTSVTLRDCGNADVAASIGAVAPVLVDRSAPSVTVTSPNGGETWRVGSSQNITWTGGDPEGIASYALAYSLDGGASYPNAIATVPGSQSSYAWTIPATPSSLVRVRATALDANGNAGDDASDANFTIAFYTLSYVAGLNGTISGTTPQSVAHGGSGTPVTAVADVGYHFVSWSDGVLTASRTDSNVMADLTVTASFELDAVGNTALAFDGTSQYVTFGASPQLGLTNFTIEVWFKKTGAGSTASSGSGGVVAVPLISKGRGEADGGNLDVNYFLGIDAAGHLVADYEEGTGQASPGLSHPVVGSSVIVDNVWYHAAAVFDGSSLRIYLNGAAEGATLGLAGRNPQSASIQQTTLATTLNSTGTPEGFFAGVLDEARIWSVAHSQCEVITGMNLEVSSGVGLAGRWGLEEGGGAIAGNSVAGSPDGNLVNGPAWVAGAPFNLVPPVVPVPDDPSGLLAAAPDAHQIQLTWTDNATSESGFEVERSISGIGGPFTLLATLGPDANAFVDAPLDAQTEYCYRVRALGCSGSSGHTTVACATTTPVLCKALVFTPNGAGTNAFVHLGNPASLQLSAFTLELWVRRDGAGISTQTASGGLTDAIPLITKGRSQNDVPANNVNYFLGIVQSSGVLGADFEEGQAGPSPGTSHPVLGTTPLLTGFWYHVAATYDGAEWKLYVNGNLDGQLAVNRPVENASTVAVALAGAVNGLNVPAGYLDGRMDEVRIWNYARTQAEIQSTFAQAIVTPTAGLVGRWGLDEAAGSMVYGTAGTGIHGTILGSAISDWDRISCVFAGLAVESGPVAELVLSPVSPNPTRGMALCRFALPRAGWVTLEVVDVAGRRVAVLSDGERAAGRHELSWNGRSSKGAVPNGVYFLRFRGLGRELTQRIIVLAR